MRTKFELEIEFPDGVFFLELVEYRNFAVSRSGASLPRTPPRTFSSTSHLLAPLAPPCRPLAGCEFHDSCPPVCAGSKLNMHADHPERRASSIWQLQVCPAARPRLARACRANAFLSANARELHQYLICLSVAREAATPTTEHDRPRARRTLPWRARTRRSS